LQGREVRDGGCRFGQKGRSTTSRRFEAVPVERLGLEKSDRSAGAPPVASTSVIVRSMRVVARAKTGSSGRISADVVQPQAAAIVVTITKAAGPIGSRARTIPLQP